MSFALLVFAFFALPVWIVKRGYEPFRVGLVMLGVSVAPMMLALVLRDNTPVAVAMLAMFSAPFALLSIIWVVVSVSIKANALRKRL